RLTVSREDIRRLVVKARALIASGIQYARQASAGGKFEDGTEGMARLKASKGRVRLRARAVENSRSRDGGRVGHVAREDVFAPVSNTSTVAQQRRPSTDGAGSQATGQETAPLATRLLDSKRKRQK